MEVSFDEKITALRESFGYTRAELAKKVGVTKSTVTRWEKGSIYPNAGNIIALSEALEIEYCIFGKCSKGIRKTCTMLCSGKDDVQT